MKKIIDVVSSVSKEAADNVKITFLNQKPKQSATVKQSKPTKKSKKAKKSRGIRSRLKLNWNMLLIGLAFVLVLFIAVIILSINSKATITVFPKIETAALEGDLKIATNQEEPDFENKVLPAKFFETQEEKWETFASTGSDEQGQKATGAITVYNNYNPPRPFSFVAKTRFVASEGAKTFRSTEKVNLPAASIVGGKVVPTATIVKVEAQEAGESYNIGHSKFSVPGLSGTAFYYDVWGESKEDMKGGASSAVKIVSKDDIEQAKEKLAIALKEQAVSSLIRFLEDGFSMDRGAVIFDNIEASCFQQAGDKAAEFNCYGKTNAKGLGYQAGDMIALINFLIEKQTDQKQNIIQETISIETFSKSSPSNSGEGILGFTIKADYYRDFSESVFKSKVKGENKESIENIIQNDFPQIGKVKARIWPFWLKRAPDDIAKIKIIQEIIKK